MRLIVLFLLSSLIGVTALANTAAVTSSATSSVSEMTDPPRPPRINYPATICPGESTSIDYILVDKEADATYSWQLTPAIEAVSSLSADQCTLSVTDVTVLDPIIDIVVVIARNSCGNTFESAPVRIVSPLDIPEITLDTICTGDAMLVSPFQTTRVRTYQWDFGPSTDWELVNGSLLEGDPFSVRFLSQGLKDFSVTIIDSDGCEHSKSYQVRVYNAPPSPLIQCIDGDDVVRFEWQENSSYRYEIDTVTNFGDHLIITDISTSTLNAIEVSNFQNRCQFAILKIIVYGDNPAPCDSVEESSPCRPSPKPTVSFDQIKKNFCIGDVMTKQNLVASIRPQGSSNTLTNPPEGVWTFDAPGQTGPDPGYTFSGSTGCFDPNGLPAGRYCASYIWTNPVDLCTEKTPICYTVYERAEPNATLNGLVDKTAEICAEETVTVHYSIYEDAPPPNVVVQAPGSGAGIMIESINDSTKVISFPNVDEIYPILVKYELPDCAPVEETLMVTVNAKPDLELECGDDVRGKEIDITWTDMGIPVDVLVNGSDRGEAMGGTHTITGLDVNRTYEIVLVMQTLTCGEVRDTIDCVTVDCPAPVFTYPTDPYCGDPIFGVPLGFVITEAPGVVGGYTWKPGTLDLMLDATPGFEIFRPLDPLINDYVLEATWIDATNGCNLDLEIPIVHYSEPQALLELDKDTVCVGDVVLFQSNNVVNSSIMEYGETLPAPATVVSGSGAGPYELTFDMPGDYKLGMQLTIGGFCQGDLEELPLVVVSPPDLTLSCRRQGETSITLEWNDDLGLEYTVEQDNTPVGGTITADSLEITGLAPNETFMFTVSAVDPFCGSVTSQEVPCITFLCMEPIVTNNIMDTICFDPLQGAYFLDVSVEADIANGGAPGTFEWNPDSQVDSGNNFTPMDARIVEYTVAGTFTDDDSCSKNISFDFIFVQTPEMVLNIVGNDTICEGGQTVTVVGEFLGTNLAEVEFVPDFPPGVTIEDTPAEGTYVLSFASPDDYDLGMSVTYYGCPGARASSMIHVTARQDLELACGAVENEAVNIVWNDLGVNNYNIKLDGLIQDPTSETMLRLDGLDMNVSYELIVETITSCGLISDTIKCQTFICPIAEVDLSGVDSEICHDSSTGPFTLDVALNSIDPSDNGRYEWDSPLVDDNDGFTPTDITITDYSLDILYTDDNGCDELHTVDFTYTESPRAMLSLTSPDTICIDSDDNKITFVSEYVAADQSLVSYMLNEPAEATVIGSRAGPDFELEFTEAGTHIISVSVDYDGCPGTPEEIEVVVQPAIEETTVMCEGDVGALILEWTPLNCVSSYNIYVDDNLVDVVTGLTATITGLEGDTDYDYIIEPISNCLCEANVTIGSCTTLPCPQVLLASNKIDTCFDTTLDPFMLDIDVQTSGLIVGGAGEWSGDIISADGMVDPSILNGPDTYTVTYTFIEAGCATALDVDLTFHAPPTVALDPQSPECPDDEMGMVIVSVEGGSPDYSYQLNDEPAQSENVFDAVPVGPFVIEVQDAMGCLVSLLDQVDDRIDPTMEIEGEEVIVEGNDAIFDLFYENIDTVGLNNIVWYLNGNIVCEGLTCMSLELQNVTVPGELIVELDYGTDCLLIAAKEFEINEVNSVYIPDMVDLSGTLGAPDNEWKAFVKGSESFITSVQVFDRWGNMVRDFENKSMDYFKEFLIWDGFSGSVAREQGVYTYVIGLEIEGETEIKFGNVTILR